MAFSIYYPDLSGQKTPPAYHIRMAGGDDLLFFRHIGKCDNGNVITAPFFQ